MKKITFVNSSGLEIIFINKPSPLVLQKFDTSSSVNIYSNKGMDQDGESYLSNTLDKRDISLEIAIMAHNTIELVNSKNKINKVFNPKAGEGFLIFYDGVRTRKVKCIINKTPYIVPISRDVMKCLISLTACDPFWADLNESRVEIALWRGSFEFPLELVTGGIEMGSRSQSLIVTVNNLGDTETGLRCEFKALATLTNPSLLNITTGEFIKINKTMTAGEVISVSTYFGDKKITSTLNGVKTNIFNYIDFESTFLQLDTGDNLMRYDADTGIDNLEVTIYYTQKYLGV